MSNGNTILAGPIVLDLRFLLRDLAGEGMGDTSKIVDTLLDFANENWDQRIVAHAVLHKLPQVNTRTSLTWAEVDDVLAELEEV